MYASRKLWARLTSLRNSLALVLLALAVGGPAHAQAGGDEGEPAASEEFASPWVAPAEGTDDPAAEGFQPIQSQHASPPAISTESPGRRAATSAQDTYIDQLLSGTRTVLNGEGAPDGVAPAADEMDEPIRDALDLTGYLRAFAALCLVLALIVFAGYGARRFAGKTPLLAGVQLGQVLGRVYLAKGASLQFVRTGGKVLVIGLTNSSVNLVMEFDEGSFEGIEPARNVAESPEQGDEGSANEFLAQLRESSASIGYESVSADDDEIASLRGDIQRLQQYLQEETRHPRD